MGIKLKDEVSRNMFFSEYIYYEITGEKLPNDNKEFIEKNLTDHIDQQNEEKQEREDFMENEGE